MSDNVEFKKDKIELYIPMFFWYPKKSDPFPYLYSYITTI